MVTPCVSSLTFVLGPSPQTRLPFVVGRFITRHRLFFFIFYFFFGDFWKFQASLENTQPLGQVLLYTSSLISGKRDMCWSPPPAGLELATLGTQTAPGSLPVELPDWVPPKFFRVSYLIISSQELAFYLISFPCITWLCLPIYDYRSSLSFFPSLAMMTPFVSSVIVLSMVVTLAATPS